MKFEKGCGGVIGRGAVADALSEHGYPISVMTLEMMAELGEGPPYRVVKGEALYLWDEALAWARMILGEPLEGHIEDKGRRSHVGESRSCDSVDPDNHVDDEVAYGKR
jgi:hypothetical protein